MGLISIKDLAPSKAIPVAVLSENLEDYCKVLNGVHELLYKETLKLRDLIDIDICPEALLPYHAKEMGIILPDFATVAAKRELIRNALIIHNRRYTLVGLEYYLNTAFAGSGIQVQVSADMNYGGILYYGNLQDCAHPNYEDMVNAGTPNDMIGYYISADVFSKSFTIQVTGTLTQQMKDFISEVAGWFVPMGDSQAVTLNITYA